jgi:hypothetical protein
MYTCPIRYNYNGSVPRYQLSEDGKPGMFAISFNKMSPFFYFRYAVFTADPPLYFLPLPSCPRCSKTTTINRYSAARRRSLPNSLLDDLPNRSLIHVIKSTFGRPALLFPATLEDLPKMVIVVRNYDPHLISRPFCQQLFK